MGGTTRHSISSFGLCAVSVAAMTAALTATSFAQSALPPVNVEPPSSRAAPARPAAAASQQATRRPARRAAARQASRPVRSLPAASAPVSAPASQQAPESAYGPVQGYVATRSATGSKTDASILETPQSISVITRDQMNEQAATTVGESLQYTAGVMTGQAGLQSRRFDPVFIRGFGGFSAAANYASYLDGLKWHFPSRTAVQIDPWMVERVEVFKGPSSVLYGQANPGGFINLVSKKPQETPSGEIFVRGGTHNYIESGFDVTGPVASDPRFLYRVVGLGRMADSQIDYQEEQRLLIAPSFTFAPSPDTKLTVMGIYQRDPKAVDSGFLPVVGTVLPSGYGRLPTNRFQGDPQWNLYNRTEKAIGYQFEHRFNDVLTFRQGFRYGNLTNDFRGVDFASLQGNNRLLNRNTGQHLHDADSFSLDNQLQAKFSTGPLKHTLLAGLDYQYMDSLWRFGFGQIGPIDLYAPVYGQPFMRPNLTIRRRDQLRQLGLYVQDQIEFGNFRLWLSGRQDFARVSSSQLNTTLPVGLLPNGSFNPASTANQDEAFTGRVGLLYLFENGFAPYASYSTSFEPVTGADRFGTAFKATTGEQIEAGFKYQPTGWNALLTVSAFNLTKQNVLSTDPANPLLSIQNGEVRSRGIEIEGKASLVDGLDLIGTYTFTDMEFTKSDNGVEITGRPKEYFYYQGKRPVAVPRHMASVWAHYQMKQGPLAGFAVGAGVRYIGDTFGTDSNMWNLPGYVYTPSKVPGFTLVDAMVSYDFGYVSPKLKGLSLAVNARNLFDKDYVAACNGFGSCAYGEGRTILATMRYRW
ncbi:iron complex outermembrane receptor protein [Enterovirga rhinocerotis]|uniref:Iron complex outermembrane receptor protein n=2 Tax=Enterovirga rhinocerotis TaxID=1339210 RepID=A0A4R7C833_9HYPH|nr:iron complex outermembrane receptor protein [Enterovirga rhinocerotis]